MDSLVKKHPNEPNTVFNRKSLDFLKVKFLGFLESAIASST